MDTECVAIASAASRKSIAIAKSIKEVLRFKTIGVFHTVHPFIVSHYFDHKYVFNINRDEVKWAIIVARIAQKNGCIGVIPVDFIDTLMFSMYRDIFLEKNIIVVAPKYEDILYASNKAEIYEKLSKILPFPRQIVYKGDNTNEIMELKPPLVVKGLGDASNPSYHLGHETAVKEAISRAPCIIQEYIEGIARGYYAVSYMGKQLIEFIHERIVEYEPIGGASLEARGYIQDPSLISIGRRVVEALNWSGHIMVETRMDPETGDYYIIEVNPKFWGSIDLSTYLGFHFPAIVTALYIYGYEKTRKLIEDLYGSMGSYTWILDGLRYLPKSPRIWFKMALDALKNPMATDVDILDLGRSILQIITAIKRFSREKRRWISYMNSSQQQYSIWIKKFLNIVRSGDVTLIMDFDGTIANLPVDWISIRKELVSRGYLYRWESIRRGMHRLWKYDRATYDEVSRIIKEYEEESLDRARLFIDIEDLKKVHRCFPICIATKQASDVVHSFLVRHGIARYVDIVIGRDWGVGPDKCNLYRACIDITKKRYALVLDDSLEYLVKAYRLGLVPIHIDNRYDIYIALRSIRLGIPSLSITKAMNLIYKAIGYL